MLKPGTNNKKLFANINQDLKTGTRGIEVEPANIECPGQNPVERHIQTLDNMEAAITIDQDLLGPEFWGLASLTVAKTLNHVTNRLCLHSTPISIFEGKHVCKGFQ